VCEEPLVVERVFGLEGEREEVLEVVDDLDLDDFFLRGGAVVGCVCTSGCDLDADVRLLESEPDREALPVPVELFRAYEPPSKSAASASASFGPRGCGARTNGPYSSSRG